MSRAWYDDECSELKRPKRHITIHHRTRESEPLTPKEKSGAWRIELTPAKERRLIQYYDITTTEARAFRTVQRHLWLLLFLEQFGNPSDREFMHTHRKKSTRGAPASDLPAILATIEHIYVSIVSLSILLSPLSAVYSRARGQTSPTFTALILFSALHV